MSTGLSSQPRLIKGALVDLDAAAFPPLVVAFQFNPESIQRRRTAAIHDPTAHVSRGRLSPAGQELGEAQTTIAPPETISMDIRLDATDGLERGDPAAVRHGVLPALSALELMTTPRASTFLGGMVDLSGDFGFAGREATPVLAFVWGRDRVFPVRLTELSINETEYSPSLSPIRVIVGVSLQVIEGANAYTRFTAARREASALRLSNAADLARSITNIG